MGTAGLSKSRLERMHRVLSGHVARGEMPGLVALVSRGDDVHVETLGTMSFGDPAPMRRDTIFRIASITKPITAVAAMILLDTGVWSHGITYPVRPRPRRGSAESVP